MPRFEEDIAAAVEAFGADNVGLVWGLGTHHWDSAEHRDQFIQLAKSAGANPVG